MIKYQKQRNGCKDVFNAFLLKHANYDGDLEIPRLKRKANKPQKLVAFSKCFHESDKECWVHFYEDDVKIERLWNNPKRYLPILKKFAGVISPDFSIYRDMPLTMQQWNIFRARTIAHWLQENGIAVIPNMRIGDKRTFETICLGVPKNSPIAIGTHGCTKSKEERIRLIKGLDYIVQKINPPFIVVYGCAHRSVFDLYKMMGIEILQFDSDFKQSHKKGNVNGWRCTWRIWKYPRCKRDL